MFWRSHLTVGALSVVVLIGSTLQSIGQQTGHGVSAGNITVVQNDTANETNSVIVSTALSINGFSIRPDSNRGDYNVQIGSGFSDDVDSGILISSVAENGRDNQEVTYPGTNYCVASVDYTKSGDFEDAYFIPVFNAPSGAEYNINVAAAFFPYDKWIGGLARNSGATNGGSNNLLTASPGLTLGTHFVNNGSGVSTINLKSLGIDSRTNGVLLVCHGKNENNYAVSQVNSDGTWTVYVKDVAADSSANEQDPVAFVFIPKTNITVVSGRFQGDGTRLMFSDTTPHFNISNVTTGVWRLTIPGHAPSTGVLILSGEGGLSQNQDNIVSYEPDGDGWLIQSRDLPNNPPGLQGLTSQPVASFVFIPASATATLVAPQLNSTNVSASPTLQVQVTNSAPGNLTVEFYGRRTVIPGEDFSLVALPDTQFYAAEKNGGLKEMFTAQTDWIISNRVDRNIAYVAHLGDVSDSGDIKSGVPNVTEWRNVTNAMYRLDDPVTTLLQHGIPYGLAVGNHDEEPIGNAEGTTTFFNQYFGISHFAGRPYYAGYYGTNNDNHFDFFSAGGLDFVVLYFKFDTNANPAVLAWADEVLRTNANRRAIIVTHNFGNTQTPLNFSPQGAAIYKALRTNDNLFLMLAGHVTGEGSRVDTYNGNTVRTFVQDFQGWTNGGSGYLRTFQFSPKRNQIVVQTYSPWLDVYETDANSEFFFDYNMQLPQEPFQLIGSISNIAPGAIASTTWSNRQGSSTYDWYVVIKDSVGNSTVGPIWQFGTRRDNAVPVATNRLVTITGDASTNLSFLAFDSDGDALTFHTNSWPLRGINSAFNPNTGEFTYTPAHGFRGLDQIGFYASDSFSMSSNVAVFLNVVSPPDSNANGLPDSWEMKYGVTNPAGDDDGDGQNNLAEYFANTNPTNASSALRIRGFTRSQNGQITLSWDSVGNSRYRIQYCDSTDGSPGPFIDLPRPTLAEIDPAAYGVPSTNSFTDDFTLTGPSTNRARYYRVKVAP